MTTKEKIEIMQHYENGGVVEVLNRNGTWSKKQKTIDGELYWSWDFFSQNYRKAKNTITIEKWLCEYDDEFMVLEGDVAYFSNLNKYPQKVKLLDTYEIEL